MGTFEDAALGDLPPVLLGSDATARLRERMNATAHRMLAEAMAKPKPTPLCIVGDRVVEADEGREDIARQFAGIVEQVDRMHEQQEPARD